MTWRVAGYVVEDLLGFGGSGEVWRGRCTANAQPVALKRVPLADRDLMHAARTEARLLSALDHPNLIRLHDVVATDDALILVLDLADGGSLADLIQRRGRLSPGEVITALSPIAAALAYAHDHGVVHGDVTSANVLFTEEGLPLLADLGVARIVGDTSAARSTPAFLDPSVAAGCVPGAASDVFMLGAVAVHALTGTPLWAADTPQESIALAVQADLADLSHRLRDVPRPIVAVLEQALAIAPQLRGTATDLALDLRHAGRPVALELRAGRERAAPTAPPPFGPRHARATPARRSARVIDSLGKRRFVDLLGIRRCVDLLGWRRGVDSFGASRSARGRPGEAQQGRPEFPRPAAALPPSPERAQLTHGARLTARPEVPTRRTGTGRAVRAAGLAAATLMSIMVIALTWSHLNRSAASPAAAGPQPIASTTVPPAAAHALAILVTLDRQRERAYADRAPALLAQVYPPGPLRSADTARLAQAVPPGCGLTGAHTTYNDPQVSPAAAGQIIVTVRATLAGTSLRCPGRAEQSRAGIGPITLRIELGEVAGGFRILAQWSL